MMPIVFGLVLVELLWVAVVDLKTQKISNRWLIFNFLAFIFIYLVPNSHLVFTWEIFLFPVGFIVIGFILFLANIMGAGDSKYIASLFLLTPISLHYTFFEKILLSTIFIGSVFFAMKLIKKFSEFKAYLISRHWAGLRTLIKSRFSYAPVILIAWILLGVEIWR